MGLNGGRLRASCLVSAASVLTGGGLLINDIETFAIKSALAFVSLLGGRKKIGESDEPLSDTFAGTTQISYP